MKEDHDLKKKLHERIQEKAATVTDPAGRLVRALGDHEVLAIANECKMHVHDVYKEMLKIGIYACRYIRNMDAISREEQIKLAESKVAIIGAGGLGGNVILLLARIGVGSLVVVDQDVFDETNLNRQALCTVNSLGMPKANEAFAAVRAINPSVNVLPHQVRLDASNVEGILAGSDVIVDALDNVPDRFLLEGAARKLGIPLVHGTLAGFEGWIMTIFPDDPGLKNIYGAGEIKCIDQESPQAVLGVPGVTPFLIAAFQVMEVLKILLGRGKIFRNRMMHIDLEGGCLNEFLFRDTDLLK